VESTKVLIIFIKCSLREQYAAPDDIANGRSRNSGTFSRKELIILI